MKDLILCSLLSACAAPAVSTSESDLCIVDDQAAGQCVSLSTYTRHWGSSRLGPQATPLSGGCQSDTLGLQCWFDFDLLGTTYTVVCGFAGDDSDAPFCEVQ